jgi:hypothetical protein
MRAYGDRVARMTAATALAAASTIPGYAASSLMVRRYDRPVETTCPSPR